MRLTQIDKRYTTIAESDCCLSCGNASDLALVKPGEVCIDLGSGRGTDVIRMAGETGDSGKVYGIDISEGMIEKARMNAEKFGVRNAEFIRSELENIPLPDQTADLIVSNCTLNHVENKDQVWNEIHRILKKGGRFVISDIYAVEPIADEFRNDPVAVAECWAGAITKEEYLKCIADADLDDFEILNESEPYVKGNGLIASFTISGTRKNCGCCC